MQPQFAGIIIELGLHKDPAFCQLRFDEKNPDRGDKIIVCQKTQIAPKVSGGNWIGGHAIKVSSHFVFVNIDLMGNFLFEN